MAITGEIGVFRDFLQLSTNLPSSLYKVSWDFVQMIYTVQIWFFQSHRKYKSNNNSNNKCHFAVLTICYFSFILQLKSCFILQKPFYYYPNFVSSFIEI